MDKMAALRKGDCHVVTKMEPINTQAQTDSQNQSRQSEKSENGPGSVSRAGIRAVDSVRDPRNTELTEDRQRRGNQRQVGIKKQGNR